MRCAVMAKRMDMTGLCKGLAGSFTSYQKMNMSCATK